MRGERWRGRGRVRGSDGGGGSECEGRVMEGGE